MNEKKRESNRILILAGLFLLFVGAAVYATFEFMGHREMMQVFIAGNGSAPFPANTNPANMGPIGDSYGAITSLLSLLTVIGLALTFVAQIVLLLNEKSRNERADKAGHLDSFEKSFYQLLDLFISTRNVLEGVETDSSGKIIAQVKSRIAIVASLSNLSTKLNLSREKWEDKEPKIASYLSDWWRDARIPNPLTYRQTFLLLKSLLVTVRDLKKEHESEAQRYLDILDAILSGEERYFIALWIMATGDTAFKCILKDLNLLPDATIANHTVGISLQKKIAEELKG